MPVSITDKTSTATPEEGLTALKSSDGRSEIQEHGTVRSSRKRGHRAAWALAYGFLLLYSIGLTVPFDLKFIHSALLDESWGMTLNEAWSRNSQFGTDLVFSYGPYGFIAPDFYFPGTWHVYLLTRLVIAAVFCWVVMSLAKRLRKQGVVPIAAFISLGTAVAAGTMGSDIFFPVCGGLLIIRYFGPSGSEPRRQSKSQIAALVALIALIALMKFAWLIFAIGIVVVIGIDQLLDPRSRRPWVPAAFLIFIAALWLAARQKVPTFIPYILHSLEFARGYNLAMGLPGGRDDVLDFGAATFIFGGSVVLVQWKTRRWRVCLPIAAFAILVFVLFKNSFVRHDDAHSITAPAVMLSIVIFHTAAFWPRGSQRVQKGVLAFAVTIAATTAASVVARNGGKGPVELALGNLRNAGENWASVIRLAVHPSSPRRQYELALAEIRRANPLPRLDGTTDIYPNGQMVLFAYGLNYDPRPVFQSYAAFTPGFEGINANHIRGDAAPDNILFDIATIDGRFPAFDDGLSWPDLLTCYKIASISPTFLVLKRSAARGFRLEPISTRTVGFDENIRIPNLGQGPVWARIKVRLNRRGELAVAALRPPLLDMDLETVGGKRRYRFIPGCAEAGFLISPLIEDRDEFASLAAKSWLGELNLKNVDTLKISGMSEQNVKTCYSPEITTEFFQLLFEHQDLQCRKQVAAKE